jgi:hypothetical protein
MSRLALLALLAACGEEVARSGVDPATPVIGLTSADVQLFCEWAIALEGGAGNSHECDNGTTLTTRTVASCVDTLADLTCPDLIGDFEDCLIEVAGNLCLIPDTDTCFAFDACFP